MFLKNSMLVALALAVCLSAGNGFALTLDEALQALPKYELGSDEQVPVAIETAVKAVTVSKKGGPELSAKLAAVLTNAEATAAAKVFVCRQLYLIGGEESIDAMAGLLGDAKLAHMARQIRFVADIGVRQRVKCSFRLIFQRDGFFR